MTDLRPDSKESIFYAALRQKPTQELTLLLIELRNKYDHVLWLAHEAGALKSLYADGATVLGMLLTALPKSRMASHENARALLISCLPDWGKVAVVVFEGVDVAPDTSEIIDRLVTLGARPYELPAIRPNTAHLIRRFAALGL